MTKFSDGKNVQIFMFFDGTEGGVVNGAKFWQYKIRYATNDAGDKTSVAQRTFYCGTYNLKDDGNYTEGELILTYLYGGNIVENKISDAITAATSDNQEDVLTSLTNTTSYGTNEDLSDSDIEKFTFSLGGQSLFTGYSTMDATAKENCSWDVTSRSFNLLSGSSEVPTAVTGDVADVADDAVTSVIGSAPVSYMPAEK